MKNIVGGVILVWSTQMSTSSILNNADYGAIQFLFIIIKQFLLELGDWKSKNTILANIAFLHKHETKSNEQDTKIGF